MKRLLRMKIKYVIALTLILLFLCPVEPASAADEKARGADTLTIYLENDLFGFDNWDRYYTHGTKISWISQDLTNYRDILPVPSFVHRWVEQIPYLNDPQNLRTVSLSLSQNIYTPADRERTDLILYDRPYAGVTYLGLGLHSRNSVHMDTLELDIGIVGRHSYAQDIQEVIHKWTGTLVPKGWEHQLHDEPLINLYIERKWKALQKTNSAGLGFDFIPHAGLGVGNAYTGVNMGGQIRFGWNIPNDYGTYLIRAGSDSNAPLDDTDPRFFQPFHRLGLHLFLAVDGKAVARNILLDGNTFRDSHSVDKKPFVVDFIGGVGMIIHQIKITYSYVYRTKEFKAQHDEQQFGAISVSFTF